MKRSFYFIGGLACAAALIAIAAFYGSGPGRKSGDPTIAALTAEASSGQRLARLGDLHELRASHSATLLPDGKVLIAAGFRKGPDGYSQLYSATAEIYDPAKRSFTYTGSLHIARCGQTATLLADGREVLITGGNNDQERIPSAELYDIQTGKWTLLPDMRAGREGHEAILLKTGQVLIVGGAADPGNAIELYDPQTRSFQKTGSPSMELGSVNALALKDGRVLIVGGSPNHQPSQLAVIFDPVANRFNRVGDMTTVRYKCASALLPDGKALIIGGSNNRDWKGKYRSTELFDPSTNSFKRGPDLNYERFKLAHAVNTIRNGSIIVTGGDKHIEMLDTGLSKWTSLATLDQPYYFSSTTLLPGGDILITGGYGNDAQPTAKAWIFTP